MSTRNFLGFLTRDLSECYATGGAGISVQSNIYRTGGWALCSSPGSSGATGFVVIGEHSSTGSQSSFSGSPTSMYFRFYFYFAGTPTLDSQQIALSKLRLKLTPDCQLAVYDYSNVLQAASETALSPETWYRIEIYINITTTHYEIKVDGETILSGDCYLGATSVTDLTLGKTSSIGYGASFYYDDVVISDSEWPGPGYVQILTPTGQGFVTQWEISGAVQPYMCVDDLATQTHDGDNTYLKATAAGRAGYVLIQTPSSKGITATERVRTIKAITIHRYATTLSTVQTHIFCSGVGDLSSSDGGSSTYMLRAYLTQNRSYCDYTKLSSVQIGIISGSTGEGHCTAQSLIVDVTEPRQPINTRTTTVPGLRQWTPGFRR